MVTLKRDAIPNVVLNQLYKHTAMQSTFGVIMLALDDGAPKVMNLKTMLERYIAHRHQVVVRRTQFDLDAAQAREHILEGLKICVDNIDEVVRIIRESKDVPEADARLRKRFGLSEKQADAILNMRLAKLTGLEIEKLEAELAELNLSRYLWHDGEQAVAAAYVSATSHRFPIQPLPPSLAVARKRCDFTACDFTACDTAARRIASKSLCVPHASGYMNASDSGKHAAQSH